MTPETRKLIEQASRFEVEAARWLRDKYGPEGARKAIRFLEGCARRRAQLAREGGRTAA